MMTDEKYTFPQKLYRMLEYADKSPDLQTIISWQPHGRSFIIKDKKRLQKEFLPLFFATGQYDSFRRNLNHWGFSQIKAVNRPDCKSYYHDYFLRTRMDLSYMIKRVQGPKFTPSRTPVSKNGTKRRSIPFQEPKFHEMEWLPQIKNQNEEKKECYSSFSASSLATAMTSNLDFNEGNIWDDKNWQQLLIEQYMLLPKDLSVLNSVFDHESCQGGLT